MAAEEFRKYLVGPYTGCNILISANYPVSGDWVQLELPEIKNHIDLREPTADWLKYVLASFPNVKLLHSKEYFRIQLWLLENPTPWSYWNLGSG